MTSSTETPSSPDKGVDPDEKCFICEVPRDQHGDMAHQFSLDGTMTPVKPGPAPRQIPPEPMGATNVMITNMVLRLVEVLTANGTLSGEDLVKVFGGNSPDRG